MEEYGIARLNEVRVHCLRIPLAIGALHSDFPLHHD